MKWIDLVNSNLKNEDIKYFLNKYKYIENLLMDIKKFNYDIQYEIRWAYKNPYKNIGGYRVININDLEYPSILKQVPSCPPFLYIIGKKIEILNSVAVVGTRNCTNLGLNMTSKILSDLSQYKSINIVSGLLTGIDTKVINESINMKQNLITVIPTDILGFYPSVNLKLKEKICENGTIISEIPVGKKIKKENFIMQNRIISGLSRAVCVIETALKGQSMITAKCALEYDRDVYCLPADIFSKTFSGCNYMIKNNYAKLITSGHDISNEYGWRLKNEEKLGNS